MTGAVKPSGSAGMMASDLGGDFKYPDTLNVTPDELAWAHVKTKIAKRTAQTKTELKAVVERAMRQLQKMPKIVAGFFHTPTCVYAKA